MTKPEEKHPYTVVVAVNAATGGVLAQVAPPDDVEAWAKRLIDAADPAAPLTWTTHCVQAYDERHAMNKATRLARGEDE